MHSTCCREVSWISVGLSFAGSGTGGRCLDLPRFCGQVSTINQVDLMWWDPLLLSWSSTPFLLVPLRSPYDRPDQLRSDTPARAGTGQDQPSCPHVQVFAVTFPGRILRGLSTTGGVVCAGVDCKHS